MVRVRPARAAERCIRTENALPFVIKVSQTLGAILDVLERDASAHTLGAPADEAELQALEGSLGHSLPVAFRDLLKRFDGGVLYSRHEIFGARRVMIHDIELVPDVLSMRRQLEREGHELHGLLPLHRGGGVVHGLDLATGAVVALTGGSRYADLLAFLEGVLLQGADRLET